MTQADSSWVISKTKVILLGDPTVGKTSIISAIRQLQFQQKQQPTVGIDFFAKIVTKNNKSYKLQFWDTAGQQRFRSIIPSYVRNANVGIIVFDLNRRSSYESVDFWLETFKENSPEYSQIIAVGNKLDLETREVQRDQAQQKFKQQLVGYVQISAKTNQNVDKLTELLINCIDASSFDLAEQSIRAKSYTKLQQLVDLVDELPAALNKPKKCCII